MEETLNKFREYLKNIDRYSQAVNLLSWDLQTGAPKDSIDSKIDALSFFSTEIFRLSTSDTYGRYLDELSEPDTFAKLDEAMQLTVKRYKRDYERFCRIPEDFFTEFTKEKAISENAWEKAKEAKDFSVFEPHLDKIINMTRQYVSFIEPEKETYDVLIDMFEKGMDSESIDRIFDELREGLLPLIDEVKSRPAPDLSALKGYYDKDAQRKVQKLLLDYIGFNFDRGNIAESVHPFTMTLCSGDVRVTNNYNPEDPIDAMFSSIHEGGHAIFDQSIDDKYRGTAVAEVEMMGLHESQSRFFENILGRNINFWIPVYDDICNLLPQLKEVPLETFDKAINCVKPGPVRLLADQLTYCMHIILRYDMEKAIFRDNVQTHDLPDLWNRKSMELLGAMPADDSEGILQDVHWSDGSFGYFPSYLLGSIYDGMYLEQIEKELGSIDKILAEGRIKDITHWLNKNIHQYGSLYTSKEVLKRVCGSEITAQPLLRYFRKKYENI